MTYPGPVHTDLLGQFPAQMKRVAQDTEAAVAGSTRFVFWTGPVTPNADGRFYVSFPELGSLAGIIVTNTDPGSGGYPATPTAGWNNCAVGWQVLGPPSGIGVWVQQVWITYYVSVSASAGGPGRVTANGHFIVPMQVSIIGWGAPK